MVREVLGRPHPAWRRRVVLGHKCYWVAGTLVVGVDAHKREVHARFVEIVPESDGVQVVERRPAPQVHGRERERVSEGHADDGCSLARGVFLVDSFYGDEKVLAGVVGTVIRAVGKPDPVRDVGACHVARVVDVVKDNEIDRIVVRLKVQGGGQRLCDRKVLERAIPVDRDLDWSRKPVAVNDSEVRRIAAKLLRADRRGNPSQQQGEEDQQGDSERGSPCRPGHKETALLPSLPARAHPSELAQQRQGHGTPDPC